MNPLLELAALGIHSLITVNAMIVLRDGELTHSEVARQCEISNSAVTLMKDSMVKSGFAETIRVPSDRRHIYIRLTPTGLNIAKRIHLS
jgi:DNA-binding MarR family transcriptional regulator